MQNALRGRENPLPDIVDNLDFTLETFEASVGREVEEQFNVSSENSMHARVNS